MLSFLKKHWKKYWGLLKHHFHEVMETKHSPHSIGLGFAIGTFISVLPTPFLNILIGLIIVAIFEEINKFSLFFSLIFWNPVNLAPIYLASYKIGELIFGGASIINYELSFLDQVWIFTRRFLIGNILIAVTISVLSYFVVKKLVVVYRKRYGISNKT